jgi:single-stranded DNA-binding protein
VEGKINSRSYTDKEGQEKTMTEIVASDIIKTVRKTETA